MKKIIFATNNKHKADEIRMILGEQFDIITLKEAGIFIDIPEPHHTLKENAIEKAQVIYEMKKENCFSEDTGLEVEALDGAPGVFSARYAGEKATADDNIKKLLLALDGKSNRKACFTTCICLILDGKQYFFEGKCHGTIATTVNGEHGFGYDPVFIPDGYQHTFAELDPKIKSEISHRKKAVSQMVDFLFQTKHNK
ncbi:MAG: RdgB/HAM1 family non-canonical purine pyrophosphatase [Bacteroidota bacterium]|jgi:XTP/dITP diphosphohydrolase